MINLNQEVENACLLAILLEKKGRSMYDIETKEVFVSRDVVFVENTFAKSLQEFWDFGQESAGDLITHAVD